MTAITPSDVLFKLSAPNANSGNIVAGYPGSSWGGYLSTTVMSASVPLNNIWSDVTGAENAAGQVDYACIFIQNNTATGNSMGTAVAWLPLSQITGTGTSFLLGGDPTGVTAINNSNPQAVKINSSIIAPAGVTFSAAPTNTSPAFPSYTNGIQLGNIAPTQCVAVWIQRTALNSSTPSLNNLQIQVNFNTP